MKIEENLPPSDHEPFKAPLRTTWGGGKVIITKSSDQDPDDWLGLDSLTSTRDFTTDSSWKNAEEILSDNAYATLNNPYEAGITLPITYITRSTSALNDPKRRINLAAIVETPEIMLAQGRNRERAFSVTNVDLGNVEQEKPYKKLVGFDVFAPIRKPVLMFHPTIPPKTESKYKDHFILRNYNSDSSWVQPYEFLQSWGIWSSPSAKKYLPMLAILTTVGTSVLKDKFIAILGGFGDNVTDYKATQTKLDFMRAFNEVSGKWWHFATNPIIRKGEGHKGIVFVDPIFSLKGSYDGSKNDYVTLETDNPDRYLGKPGSRSRQVLALLTDFHAGVSRRETSPQNNLLRLQNGIKQITG